MSDEENEIPESMAGFFDARAEGYDEHIRGYVFDPDTTFKQFYGAISSPIRESDEPVRILDLGCGTGLELDALFEKVPHAMVTGVDLSGDMLALLREKYSARSSQITLVKDSYLTMPLGIQAYDYAVSAMASHHLLHDTKRELYRKICTALKPGGKYVEGDSVTVAEMESQFADEYQEQTAMVPPADDGHYHIDLPFSIETQRSLLMEAGFRDFELVWRKDGTEGWNFAVFVVTR